MKPRRKRQPPGPKFRITFDQRRGGARPRCGCGWVAAKFYNDAHVGERVAIEHAETHVSK